MYGAGLRQRWLRKKSLYKLVKEAGSRVMAEKRENLAAAVAVQLVYLDYHDHQRYFATIDREIVLVQ